MARDGRAREASTVLEKAASASPKYELEMKLASVQLLLAEVNCHFSLILSYQTFVFIQYQT